MGTITGFTADDWAAPRLMLSPVKGEQCRLELWRHGAQPRSMVRVAESGHHEPTPDAIANGNMSPVEQADLEDC